MMRRPTAVTVTKRALDVAVALVLLVLVSPLVPVVAAAIRLDSRGPVFFRQRRAGLLLGREGGRVRFAEFDLWKFRTMVSDAERLTGPILAGAGDPRVTRVGRLLRRTRLDELPQLWNVLRGDMSLVGPRPERPELLEALAAAVPFFEERTRFVKPGLTGLAQVHLGYAGEPLPGRATDDLRAVVGPIDDASFKLLYDLAYAGALERFSTFVATELAVLARTPFVMLRGGGR